MLKFTFFCSFLWLIFISYGFFVNDVIYRFERQFPVLQMINQKQKLKWVVVLGGGITDDGKISISSQFSSSSMNRLIEGIRLIRKLPESKLVLSGGELFGKRAEALLMKQLAIDLGVSEKRIILETKSKDSKDQAVLIGKMLKKERFILVTSAYHMPRVNLLFKKQKLSFLPAPTDFLLNDSPVSLINKMVPSVNQIIIIEKFIKEYLGISWAYLRGQI